jgi:sugar lactone lactonase YvrE
VTTPRVLVESGNVVGESPLWSADEGAVYWVDVNGFLIQRFVLASEELKVWRFQEPVASLSMTTDPEWMIVAFGSGVALWSPQTGERRPFANPEPSWPKVRLNDGAAGPNGDFWVGSMANNVGLEGEDTGIHGTLGRLSKVSPQGEVTVHDEGFIVTNTVVWSPDHRTFYCGCSEKNVIYAYDFDGETGTIGNKRPFLEGFDRGVPDGSAIDALGYLYNCRWGGGCIVRIAPDGDVAQVIEMPVANVTHAAFGGDDHRTMFVTTAGIGRTEAHAGDLFTLAADVPGLARSRFRLASPAR